MPCLNAMKSGVQPLLTASNQSIPIIGLNAMKSGVQPHISILMPLLCLKQFECDEERSATSRDAEGAEKCALHTFECDEERSATHDVLLLFVLMLLCLNAMKSGVQLHNDVSAFFHRLRLNAMKSGVQCVVVVAKQPTCLLV